MASRHFMLLVAIIVLVFLITVLSISYVYTGMKIATPVWRRLPARPGLPPDMEYHCWTEMRDFDPEMLSDAVVLAVTLLSPVLGRATLFTALRGARLLVYRDGTYPGSECGPSVAGILLTPRWAAVETRLLGVAHAVVHLVERHSGAPDYEHGSWGTRGITPVVATYEERRSRYL